MHRMASIEPRLLVGAGAGFSGDRLDAAEPVVDTMIARGLPSVLIFETLAERTLALAQIVRRQDPEAGYEPLLVEMLSPVLAKCLANSPHREQLRRRQSTGCCAPYRAARARAGPARAAHRDHF